MAGSALNEWLSAIPPWATISAYMVLFVCAYIYCIYEASARPHLPPIPRDVQEQELVDPLIDVIDGTLEQSTVSCNHEHALQIYIDSRSAHVCQQPGFGCRHYIRERGDWDWRLVPASAIVAICTRLSLDAPRHILEGVVNNAFPVDTTYDIGGGDVLAIGGECLESYPCQHPVRLNGVYRPDLSNGKRLAEWLVQERNQSTVPRHFRRYLDGYKSSCDGNSSSGSESE